MNYKKIHFIGIGGSSMSGLAEYVNKMGVEVTGSNNEINHNTLKLEKEGIKVFIGHNKNNITNQDLVVYTAAISSDNPELVEAQNKNILVLERAKFLGMLTKQYKNTICVSGTHGKSTTSSMIALCFLKAGKDPSIQVGAIIKEINSNNHCGKKDYFVMEACEYRDQFLNFFPTAEVILNIDADHLDYFKTFSNIVKSFQMYVKKLKSGNVLVLNKDDENVYNLKDSVEDGVKVITYGINSDALIKATDISFDENGCATFKVNDEGYTLSVKGLHNVYNALATIAISKYYNLEYEAIKKGLLAYTGVERRFEYLGSILNNVSLYDDYAHHPTEIKTTLDSVKKTKHNKSWAIFQPHTYSRTKEHLEEFADVLKNFDNVVIAPIYAARETNTYNVSEDDLVSLIKKSNKNCIYIDNFDDIAKYIYNNVNKDDLVITIGAGPINDVIEKLKNIH